jgi:hypothetical protein
VISGHRVSGVEGPNKLVSQDARSRGDEVAILEYRRLGPRESRRKLFKLVSSEDARKRDRELSASRRIGSRKVELRAVSATVDERR